MPRFFFLGTLIVGLMVAQQSFAAGAIAVDDEEGLKASDVGYGIGSGSTREEAAGAALAECRKAGNGECKVVVRYDSCGAYAASKSYGGSGWGGSETEARENALEACGKGCKVIVSDCE